MSIYLAPNAPLKRGVFSTACFQKIINKIYKRPIVFLALYYILGISFAMFFSFSLFKTGISALTLSILTVFLSVFAKRKIILFMMALMVLCGSFSSIFFYNAICEKYTDFNEKFVTIHGFIDDEPDFKNNRVSYTFKISDISYNNIKHNKSGKVIFSTPKETSLFHYGQELYISGEFKIAGKAGNPGGFDYKDYLARGGLSGSIFAKSDNIKALDRYNGNILVKAGLSIKHFIVSIIDKSLPKQQASLLNGMLIGYRDGFDSEVQNAFSDAGLTHIMAASGMNVAFIIMPLVFIFRKIGLSKRITNCLAIAALFFFLFITGFQPSITRAAIMGTIILMAGILKRDTDIYTSISFAAFIMLIFNPLLLVDAGFLLSFGATLSLVLFYKPIKEYIKTKYIPELLKDVLACTVAAQLGVLPVTLYFFNKLSIISVLTNIVVVPIVEAVSVIGAVMAVLGSIYIGFSQILGYCNYIFLTFILYTVKLAASLPYATIKLSTPSAWSIIIYYTAISYTILIRMKLPIKKEALISAALIFGMILITVNFRVPALEVWFVDVGQGDCILFKTEKGRNILIDGGGKKLNPGETSNIGETTVLPMLYDLGITNLDMVIATHGHEDHIQGLEPVIKELKVKTLILPQVIDLKPFDMLLEAAGKKNTEIKYVKQGDKLVFDSETNADVLWPDKDYLNTDSLNMTSVVLKLQYERTSMLLAGDLESEGEEKLLESNIDLKSDILKAGHHGSSTSSSEEFLSEVKPMICVISVGKNNYGHPSQEVLDELSDRNIKYYRTDESGAIMLRSNGNKWNIKTMLD